MHGSVTAPHFGKPENFRFIRAMTSTPGRTSASASSCAPPASLVIVGPNTTHGLLGATVQPPHPDASNLLWALHYATHGRSVLPLYSVEGDRCACGDVNCRSPGKHPRTQHGVM